MLECNVISTLFAHYICLHDYIHFIYLLIQIQNSKICYRIPQISQKKNDICIFAHIAQSYFKETYIC